MLLRWCVKLLGGLLLREVLLVVRLLFWLRVELLGGLLLREVLLVVRIGVVLLD